MMIGTTTTTPFDPTLSNHTTPHHTTPISICVGLCRYDLNSSLPMVQLVCDVSFTQCGWWWCVQHEVGEMMVMSIHTLNRIMRAHSRNSTARTHTLLVCTAQREARRTPPREALGGSAAQVCVARSAHWSGNTAPTPHQSVCSLDMICEQHRTSTHLSLSLSCLLDI
jgi:hypothetical protein